ncbi:MAG TPA: arginine--tRNA ligase [Chitinophagaceae bacterium]|nr:arginine--tRNA ligase [Chitinophagaceae bacterium]
MSIINRIKALVIKTLKDLYQLDMKEDDLTVNITKPEFEGDYTIVLFSFIKQLKKSPEQLGKEIGEGLLNSNPDLFSSYNVIKGFLNLVIADKYWVEFLQSNYSDKQIGKSPANNQTIIVEYSSPNTNKPLHLGHLRNNFLGWSIAEILKASGYKIAKTCIVNDRGIHICKSMIAWQLFANGETPDSTGKKGDHFVGDYYVKFNDEYNRQVNDLAKAGMSREEAEKEAPVMKAAQQMLLDWEAGKPEIIDLWKKMNGWVYEGFDITYKRIGSDFDKIYYESDTYLLGKDIVQEGLQKGVFFKKEDGSVWIDLTADGLDEKLVMRKDGTSVYITQDLGLAEQKHEEYKPKESIYVVGDEQNYHFKVLKLMAGKLQIPGANGIYHLNYGMVELPTGKMKSREGTVVDADDILDEMLNEAEKKTKELGKTEGFSKDELKELYEIIGLGGLKFFLLRVDPKKRMVFNPEESIDLHGFTATFIQYAHARTKSVLREEKATVTLGKKPTSLLPLEKQLIVNLEQYPSIIEQAVMEHNPSVIAIYTFNLAQLFNSFYNKHKILKAETEEKKELRLQLSELTANIIASSMGLLGIKVPERM